METPLYPVSRVTNNPRINLFGLPRVIELNEQMQFDGLIPAKTRFRLNKADGQYVSEDPQFTQRFEADIMRDHRRAFFKIISK